MADYQPTTTSTEAPPSAPSAEDIGEAARRILADALRILDDNDTPLAKLLATQATKRPDLLIKALGRFAPNRTQVDLGQTIQAMHLAALRALASQPVNAPLPPPIDITPSPALDKPDWLA